MYNFPRPDSGIRSVTDAEVRAFLHRYFVEDNMIMMLFGPKDDIIEILEKHWPDVVIHVLTTESAIE